MDENTYTRLRELIAKTDWVKSKTYAPPFDHQYVVKTSNLELCRLLERAIAEDGYDKDFKGHPHRYIDIDQWRYWHYQIIYNRDLADKVMPE